MNRETMEYALNQPVIYEHAGGTYTGKIVGESGDNFIILLDMPLLGGTRAVLQPSSIVRPLACHWCQDAQKVTVPSFTVEQAETGSIPTIDCPYCTKN